MKLGLLFTVDAVIAAAFGIGFVLVPAELLQQYGVAVNPGTALLGRLFGGTLLGLAVLCWQVRAEGPSDALRAIVLSLFILDLLGFVISLQGVLSGAVNALGWLTVVIYGVFAAGFGYFAFGKARVRAGA
jgi:hypothetical protein